MVQTNIETNYGEKEASIQSSFSGAQFYINAETLFLKIEVESEQIEPPNLMLKPF